MLMKDLQDRYSGKLGFVIGAGPSLRFIDEKQLKPYVTITVNSGIVKVPECDFFFYLTT